MVSPSLLSANFIDLKSDVDNDQLEGLLTTITNQDEEIEMKDKEITRLQAKIEKIEKAEGCRSCHGT